MVIEEKIQENIHRLPASLQAEVLDYVEFLVAKAARNDESELSAMSLSLAMRDMEDEETPEYRSTDLRDRFS